MRRNENNFLQGSIKTKGWKGIDSIVATKDTPW